MSPTSTKKTTAKKTAKKTVSKKKASKKKVASQKATEIPTPDQPSIGVTSEERWRMIGVAAYHKAEKRGFSPGNELHDWAEAEKEIDKLLLG